MSPKTKTWPARLPRALSRLAGLAALLLAACAPLTPPPPPVTLAVPAATPLPLPATATLPLTHPSVLATQQALLDRLAAITAAPPAQAQALADDLWQALLSSWREPAVYDLEAYFFYEGPAQTVAWVGDFEGWTEPGLLGMRVGQTNLWMAQQPMPFASRAEYKLSLDNAPGVPDPANPRLQPAEVNDIHSVLEMPGYTVSDESQRRAGVPAGAILGPLTITSRYLGYALNYWVYTPPGYPQAAPLPALYLMDGESFVSQRQGALPAIMDNLIAAGRIPPVLAVFVSELEPGHPANNRRQSEFLAHPVDHAEFLAGELVPAIDAAYHTDPRPAARAIVGASFGGLSAFFVGLTEADTFHSLAAFSPSLWALDTPESQPNLPQVLGVRIMEPVVQAVTECAEPDASQCPRLPLRIFMTSGLPNWDVGDLTPVVTDLHRLGYALDFQTAREAHTWSQWRGLSDEMLIYFFGTP